MTEISARRLSRPRRFRHGIAVLTVLVAAVTALVMAPANDARAAETGVSRCLAGARPDVNVIVSHQGSAGATNFPLGENPPNIINPGDAVTVSAGGFINILPFPFYEYYGPSGKAENSSHSYPVPGARKYASLWRFNNNPGGWVDGDWRHTVEFGHCRPAPSLPVRLAFLINDDLLWDNSGEFLYVIQIWRSR